MQNHSFMSAQDLYQEILLEHSRSPRNFLVMKDHDCKAEGVNPACGDELTIFIKWNKSLETVEEASFHGQGCAISQAAASIFTSLIKGKTKEQIRCLLNDYEAMFQESVEYLSTSELGELISLQKVREFPQRIRCAMLCCEAIRKCITTL